MFKEAVYHRPKNNFAYAYDKETLHIRIQTKKNDIQSITLHYKDPFSYNGIGLQHTTIPMKKTGSGDLFDFWQGEIKPPHRRIEYSFELFDGNETTFYSERGFFSSYETMKSPFKFPFLNGVDVFEPPHWVKETIWYQIFPERFANGDASINPENILDWGTPIPKWDVFYGGDLEGVRQHLDYLQELGITGIYFTPIFEASTNHKYDTIDYLKIDPHFGDKEKLKQLVEECHQRGIKVMLDAVFNHCGFYFAPFQDVLKNGEDSKFKDWFHIREFPIETEPVPNYDTFAFTHMMPKFNTENPEVKEYLLGVARYWIEECQIDGWRLDVANEVDHSFWREFRKVVKSANQEHYILGELWHDAMPWLLGDQFDAVMNYPFTNLVMDYVARNSLSTEQFKNGIHELLFMYPKQVHEVAFNLLDSHDTARILHDCGEDKQKVRLLLLLLLTFTGSPCIYYGDEVGLTGKYDPDCRRCMEWDENKRDKHLFDFVKTLISLRKKYPSLSQGEIVFHESNDILIYEKQKNNESIMIMINNSNENKIIDINISHSSILLNAGRIINEEKVFLPSKGFIVWQN